MPRKNDDKTPIGYHRCPQCGGVAGVYGAAKEGKLYLRHDDPECRLYQHARGATAQAVIEANMVDSPEKLAQAPEPEPVADVVPDVVPEPLPDAVEIKSDVVEEGVFDPDRDMTASGTTSGGGNNGPLWALLAVLVAMLVGGGYVALKVGAGQFALNGPDDE